MSETLSALLEPSAIERAVAEAKASPISDRATLQKQLIAIASLAREEARKAELRGQREEADRLHELQNEAAFGKVELQRDMGKEIRGWRRGKPGPIKEKDKPHDEAYLKGRLKAEGIAKIDAERWQLLAAVLDEPYQKWLKEQRRGAKEITSAGLLNLAKRRARGKPPKSAPDSPGDIELIESPIGELSARINPESVDVILTDPPYPRKYLPLYSELSECAVKVLKPGGSCFVMAGQSYLPQVLNRLQQRLQYRWTLAYLTPGGQSAQLFQRTVNTFWKPVLWLVKGKYKGDWLGDVVSSDVNDNDKRFHHWGQSESGMARLVERCTRPGQIVLDPFVGGATTGVVCRDLGRSFIGSDIDLAAARERLAE